MGFSFDKLEAYTSSRRLVKDVYDLTGKFPNTEKYGLSDQLRRAVISIPSNIAEGSGRSSIKEKIHFIEIAYGSLMEVYCQLQLSLDLSYVNIDDFEVVADKIDVVSKLLKGLRYSFKKQLAIP